MILYQPWFINCDKCTILMQNGRNWIWGIWELSCTSFEIILHVYSSKIKSLFQKKKTLKLPPFCYKDVAVHFIISFFFEIGCHRVEFFVCLTAFCPGMPQSALFKMCPDRFEPCQATIMGLPLHWLISRWYNWKTRQNFQVKKLHQQKVYLWVPIEILSAGNANPQCAGWTMGHVPFLLGLQRHLGDRCQCLRGAWCNSMPLKVEEGIVVSGFIKPQNTHMGLLYWISH